MELLFIIVAAICIAPFVLLAIAATLGQLMVWGARATLAALRLLDLPPDWVPSWLVALIFCALPVALAFAWYFAFLA